MHLKSDRGVKSCAACDSACRTCAGPTSGDCTDPTPLTPFMDSDCAANAIYKGKICKAQCPDRQYVAALFLGWPRCERCDLTCGSCDGPAKDNCLTCNAGASSGKFVLHARACSTDVPDAHFVDVRLVAQPCHARLP